MQKKNNNIEVCWCRLVTRIGCCGRQPQLCNTRDTAAETRAVPEPPAFCPAPSFACPAPSSTAWQGYREHPRALVPGLPVAAAAASTLGSSLVPGALPGVLTALLLLFFSPWVSAPASASFHLSLVSAVLMLLALGF